MAAGEKNGNFLKRFSFAVVNFIAAYNNMLVNFCDGYSYDRIYITMEANAAYF
jgi:hypothetical protein